VPATLQSFSPEHLSFDQSRSSASAHSSEYKKAAHLSAPFLIRHIPAERDLSSAMDRAYTPAPSVGSDSLRLLRLSSMLHALWLLSASMLRNVWANLCAPIYWGASEFHWSRRDYSGGWWHPSNTGAGMGRSRLPASASIAAGFIASASCIRSASDRTYSGTRSRRAASTSRNHESPAFSTTSEPRSRLAHEPLFIRAGWMCPMSKQLPPWEGQAEVQRKCRLCYCLRRGQWENVRLAQRRTVGENPVLPVPVGEITSGRFVSKAFGLVPGAIHV